MPQRMIVTTAGYPICVTAPRIAATQYADGFSAPRRNRIGGEESRGSANGMADSVFDGRNITDQLVVLTDLVVDLDHRYDMGRQAADHGMTALDQRHDRLPFAFDAGPRRGELIRETRGIDQLNHFGDFVADMSASS